MDQTRIIVPRIKRRALRELRNRKYLKLLQRFKELKEYHYSIAIELSQHSRWPVRLFRRLLAFIRFKMPGGYFLTERLLQWRVI